MKITLYKMNIEIFRTEKKDNGETIESKSKKKSWYSQHQRANIDPKSLGKLKNDR